nr:unnamed protein product [Digitaria exilis]
MTWPAQVPPGWHIEWVPSSAEDREDSALARSAPGWSSAATWPANGGGRAEPAEPWRPLVLVLTRFSRPSRAITSRSTARLASRRASAIMASSAPPLAARSRASRRAASRSAEDLPLPHTTIFDAQPLARALLELGASMARQVDHHSSRALPRQHHSTEPLTLFPSSRTSPVHSLALAPVPSFETKFVLVPPPFPNPSRIELDRFPSFHFPHFSRALPNSPARNRIFPQIRISGRRSTRTSSPYFEPSPKSTEPSTSFTESTTLAGIELAAAAPPPHVAGELRASPGLPTATNRLVVRHWFFSPTSPTLSRCRLAGATPATSRGPLFIFFVFLGFPVKKQGPVQGAIPDGFYHLIPADGEGILESGAGEGTVDPEANPQLAQEGKPRSIT